MSEPKRDKKIQEETTPVSPVYDDSAARQQSALYEQIAKRGPFRYDAGKDPLYRLTRDRAVQDGRMAMKDAMGQAAALTGGYGSSYGQAVGQQQYDASLRSLADALPALYEQAFGMYQAEGDALRQQAEALGRQADRDYDRYRDQVGDWTRERQWQQEQENTANKRRDDAYTRLYALISATGYWPDQEELDAAGMSEAAAEALRNEYLRKTGQLPGAGTNSSRGGGRSRSSGKSERKMTLEDVTAAVKGAKQPKEQQQVYDTVRQAIERGITAITLPQLDKLFRQYHGQS